MGEQCRSQERLTEIFFTFKLAGGPVFGKADFCLKMTFTWDCRHAECDSTNLILYLCHTMYILMAQWDS